MTVSDLIKNVRMLNPSGFKVFLKQIRDLEKEIAADYQLIKSIGYPQRYPIL